MEFNFDRGLSYALKRLGTPNMTLKTEQVASIMAVCNGKDVFVWLPTGFGKSVCYEVLPFVMDCKLGRVDSQSGEYSACCSVVLVISPLISLMVDQVLSLRRRGVDASIISYGVGVKQELLATEDDLGKCSLLFCAPEALVGSRWREAIENPVISDRVVAVVVDEAHCVSKWSKDFRPAYGRLHEVRALVPSGVPYLACTATVTRSIREEVIQSLNMVDYEYVYKSPDRPNIFYEVYQRSDIETDMKPVLSSLKDHQNRAPRVIIYCRTMNMCADIYAHFHFELGDSSYYPSGAQQISDNRLFGMFHSGTPDHNKDVILKSLTDPNGVVRVVFATIALGMGVNLKDVNTIYHYGAPQSIDDYFQESGRGGRSGDAARSLVFWKASDCPVKKQPTSTRDEDVIAVRRYLENDTGCRRQWLLHYFDPTCSKPGPNPNTCCDVCAKMYLRQT